VADFPANITLRLAGVGDVEGKIKKLETRFERIQRVAGDISLGAAKGGAKLATRNINEYISSLSKLDRKLGGLGGRLADVAKAFDFGGKTVVGVAGINALAKALQGLPKWLGGAESALGGFASTLQTLTSPINAVTDALQSMGPAGMATGAGVAVATAALMAFTPAATKAAKQIEELKKASKFEITQDIISDKTLTDALKAATFEQKKLSAGTQEYTQKTEEVLAIQRELTAELRRQQTVLNMVNKEQIGIAEAVRKNVRASRASRRDSGFAEFSERASSQPAIDKSINRRQRKIEKFAEGLDRKYGQAPLMLPSSEMLNAAGRGIKQLSNYYGDLIPT